MTGAIARATLLDLAARDDAPLYARLLHGVGRRAPYDRRERAAIARHAERIVAWCATATPEQSTAGMTWYARARDAAHHAADLLGIDRPAAVAGIATVSPGVAWSHNIAALAAVLDVLAGTPAPVALDRHRVPRRMGAVASFERGAVAMRHATLTGDAVEGVRAAHRDAPKVIAFAAGIATGGATLDVAVDDHAVALASTRVTPTRRGHGHARPPSGRRYHLLAASYAVAARMLNVDTPPLAQALAWVAYRATPVERWSA